MTGHIRQRSPGSFEIRYAVDGKRKTATVRGTKRDAEKELRRLLRQVDLGEHADAGQMTTGAWLTQWLGLVEETLAPQSHDRYETIIRCHLAPALGDVPLAKLAANHIAAAYAGLRMAPSTRRLIHRVLVAALARAVELSMIPRNPANVLRRRLPRVEATEMAVLTAEQVRRLLDAVGPGEDLHAPVLLALATGARRGECLALCWRNVNLDAGTVLISESTEKRTGQPARAKAPKNNRSRTVTLPSLAVAALRARKLAQAQELLRLGVRQDGSTLVCTRADGQVPSPVGLTIAFRRLMATLDLPNIHFHSLRHTHATQLLAAGVHPKVAQERLGHSTVALTIDLYSHVSEGMQRDAADKLDRLLG